MPSIIHKAAIITFKVWASYILILNLQSSVILGDMWYREEEYIFFPLSFSSALYSFPLTIKYHSFLLIKLHKRETN